MGTRPFSVRLNTLFTHQSLLQIPQVLVRQPELPVGPGLILDRLGLEGEGQVLFVALDGLLVV